MLRLGCHNKPLRATDPATLPPFDLLLLVLATRFTAAARAHTLRTRKREADDREDFITRPSISPNPGPARPTSYAVIRGPMCTAQSLPTVSDASSSLRLHFYSSQVHMPPLHESTYFQLRTALNKPSRIPLTLAPPSRRSHQSANFYHLHNTTSINRLRQGLAVLSTSQADNCRSYSHFRLTSPPLLPLQLLAAGVMLLLCISFVT
jgi:hypothetical protein